MLRNTSGQFFLVGPLVLLADNSEQTTGASIFIGGTSATAGAGTLTHYGNGVWRYAPTQEETNVDRISGYLYKAGCFPAVFDFPTTTFPYTTPGVVPAVAAGANNGLPLGDSQGRVLLQTSQPGVTIPTVTTLTNLPAITANWLTATGVDATAVTKIQTGLATPTNITAGTITTVTNVTNGVTLAANSVNAAALATDAVNEIQSGLATQALLTTVAGYLDTEISSILTVTNRLDTMMELDGSVYRLTVNALEQAPVGGGGGGATDWTADEKTAIRTILGIPLTGTTPEVPSAGALKVIDDLIDTEVGAIKAKTDNLPSDPAGMNALAVAHGAGSWTTATGFAVPGDAMAITTLSGNALVSGVAAQITTDHGSGSYVRNTEPVDVSATVNAIKTKTDNLPSDPADQSILQGLLDAIKAKTDALPASPASVSDIPTVNAIWTTALTEAYRATGATGTAAQLLYEISAHLGRKSVAGTTVSLKKLDGSTARTHTLNSSTDITSISEG